MTSETGPETGHDVAHGADDWAGRPYGLVGLIVSLIVILVLATAFCVLAATLAFAIAFVLLGRDAALGRFTDLQGLAGSDLAFVERLRVVVSLVLYAAAVAATLVVARIRAGAKWPDLVAWRPWHPFRRARLFWLLAGATIAYGLVADVVVSRVYPPSNDWITPPTGALWSGLFVMLAVVAAPVTEELLFRGWIYTSLRAAVGVWPGLVATSVLFALAHWETSHLYALAVFPVGLALGYVRERTGTIRASMTLHALYNGAASLVLLLGP